jgi:hypothetical protein
MQRLVGGLTEALRAAFGGESFQTQMQAEGEAAQNELNTQMQAVQKAAEEKRAEYPAEPAEAGYRRNGREGRGDSRR